MEQIKGIWALARENIRREMSALSFNRWIEVLQPVTIQIGILIIECPDAATKSTITDYYKDIYNAFNEAYVELTASVTFRAEGDAAVNVESLNSNIFYPSGALFTFGDTFTRPLSVVGCAMESTCKSMVSGTVMMPTMLFLSLLLSASQGMLADSSRK